MVTTRSRPVEAQAGPSNPKAPAPAVDDFVQLSDSEDDDDDEDTEKSSDEEDSDSDAAAESDDSITSARLNALLDKARAREVQRMAEQGALGGDVIKLSDDRPLPKLDASSLLPTPYFTTPTPSSGPPKLAIDPGTEKLSALASSLKRPLSPSSQPSKRLSKKQKQELREKTAGPGWFDMPAPSGLELEKIKRELEAARLSAALDPKTFLRKEALKAEVPKYVQLGRIVETKSPFERASNKNLTRAEKKRSLVDELVEDAEKRGYAKRKFSELQRVRGERGKLTARKKRDLREGRRKW